MKILALNGPNLQWLGRREPDIYGQDDLDSIMARLKARAKTLGAEVETFQSDEEGRLVTRVGESAGRYDGLILNPAAYTHTSLALADALRACALPCIEVHLSNTQARESFRHVSYTAPVCLGQIMGLGGLGYELALEGLVDYINRGSCKTSAARRDASPYPPG